MKAFFLDRDGVINESHAVNRPEEFHLLPGAGAAVRILNEHGYLVFVVTNQAGVGLGYFTENDLVDVHLKMIELIDQFGGIITEVRACMHKPSQGCVCRKPKPGMITDLMRKYDIDPSQSYMVGDRDVDIRAGHKAGVKTIFIGTSVPDGIHPDYNFISLQEAATQMFELVM